jgi:hypothetical protein
MALAIYPMEQKTIGEAQDYGIQNVAKSINEFLAEWRSFEEKTEVLEESVAEHAYFYSLFLIIANDARVKSQNKQPVELADGEELANDYAGHFTFRAILNGDDSEFVKDAEPVLWQEENSAPGQVVATHLEKYGNKEKYYYVATIDLHFKNSIFSMEKPVFLKITLKNKKEKIFYFDLAKLK